ncbi:MAG: helix-turn-helix domain-containing protein [Paraclostridium sp.]
MSKVKEENFINVQGWMVSRFGLKGNELLIYAIIYGFSQEENSNFTGSRQYLADWTNSTKSGVQKNLNSLVEKGLLVKKEIINNGVKFCEYKAITEVTPSQQSCLPPGNKVVQGGQQSCPNNIDNNIIDNIDSNLSYKQKKFKEELQTFKTELSMMIREKNFKTTPEELLKISGGDFEIIKRQFKNFSDKGLRYVISAIKNKYDDPKPKKEIKKENIKPEITDYKMEVQSGFEL